METISMTLAAASLTRPGLGYLASRRSGIETAEPVFRKGGTMSNRILVNYATRVGSTIAISAAMGMTLNQRCSTVAGQQDKEKPILNGYQKVI